MVFQTGNCKCAADRESGELGDYGRGRHTFHLHVEEQYENQVKHDVGEVDGEDNIERNTSILQSDEPADQCVVCERCRGAPDANKEILVSQRGDAGFRSECLHRQCRYWPLQQYQPQSYRKRDDQRLAKSNLQTITVIRTESLRGDTGRSHAQEIESGVEKTENRRTDRDSAEIRRRYQGGR